MPKTMKGPGIFLAQFAGDTAPFNSLKSIAGWAAGLGYKGIQIPTWDARLFTNGGGRVVVLGLGLAKAAAESHHEAAISISGVFVGTPEFASPEQFAGVGVDIRSDLYSLGVVLWEMLTGQVPFRGSPGEVTHQHQHAPLPIEQLNPTFSTRCRNRLFFGKNRLPRCLNKGSSSPESL